LYLLAVRKDHQRIAYLKLKKPPQKAEACKYISSEVAKQ